jgi:hypothetical protein
MGHAETVQDPTLPHQDQVQTPDSSFAGSKVPDSLAGSTSLPEEDILSGQSSALPTQSPVADLAASAATTTRTSSVLHKEPTTAPDMQFETARSESEFASPAKTPDTTSAAAQAHDQASTPRPSPQDIPDASTPEPEAQLDSTRRPANRFATPPVTLLRRAWQRDQPPPSSFTLGEFLTAATGHLQAALPTPGKRPRKLPLNFSPRRGRSAAAKAPATSARPTAQRRAHVQLLRTLGIIGINDKITADAMKAYDGLFAVPIPLDILCAIAAIIGRELPADPEAPATALVPAGDLLEV